LKRKKGKYLLLPCLSLSPLTKKNDYNKGKKLEIKARREKKSRPISLGQRKFLENFRRGSLK